MKSVINANTTGQALIAVACSVKDIVVGNPDTSAGVYIKLYDKATTPTTSDTPVWRIFVPPAGGGIHAMKRDMFFVNGVGVRSSGAAADSDATAPGADSIVNINT